MSQQAFNGVCTFRCFTYLDSVEENLTIRTFISDDESITSLPCVFSGVTNAFQKGSQQEVYGGSYISLKY